MPAAPSEPPGLRRARAGTTLESLQIACYEFSMKATTIKVEGDLLKELERTKPRSLSLSAYVRAVLTQEVLRRKMADAAERYVEFVRESPGERAWLDEWDGADLTSAPKRRRT